MAKRVCIIGAGIAGLVTLKELMCVSDGRFDITLFEKTSEVGGLWQYAEVSGEIGGPGFLYKSLRTNTPKQTWNFRDFQLPDDTPTWLTPQHVADHLRAYAEEFKLKLFIKFESEVTEVKRQQVDRGADEWFVTVKSACKDEPEEIKFANVIMCTGLNTKPRMPSIPGVDNFRGSVIHSSQYRVPEVYKDKKVLIVGANVSMSEVCHDIGDSASEIYVSRSRPSNKVLLPNNASFYPEVASIKQNSVMFCDGTEKEIDAIIFCIGYDKFHILRVFDKSCDFELKNGYFYPLYKGIVHAKHPTLMFNGSFDLDVAVPLYECMAMYIASVMSGSSVVPNEETMLDAIKTEFAHFFKKKQTPHFHLIGPRQKEYVNKLCTLGHFSCPQLPFILYEHVLRRVAVDGAYPEYRNESYSQTSDTTFEVHTNK